METKPLHPWAAELEPPVGGLASYPPVERWDDWREYDPAHWPKRVEKHYMLIPTICFNCEAACGLLAYVDKEKLSIQKFEGNPAHPGSRGRNCAKGPATINQVTDPERIRYPLKRVGKRGEGKWERVSWDEVLDDIAGRVRKALLEDRRTEVMYHVGRPGHELVYHQRIFHAWGVDGHNSHTNVCSASARAGYAFWHGLDRPSDREFVRKWVNWEEYLRDEHPEKSRDFENFLFLLKQLYADFTPEFAARECGVPAATIVEIAREIGRAGPALATHVWRSAAAGNLGGWQVARALEFLVVLAGAVATPGGTAPSGFHKFIPAPPLMPPPAKVWNELLLPREYPLSFFEMSFLLPHFLKEGRGKLAMYFTRVYNPVWTNPDGMSWIEILSDESKVECHACLTPTWSETAWFADYVLPMGHASERHDLMSQETHAARWIGFRQPVLRVALERQGKKFNTTYEAHREAGLGEVWEEDEFWIELSWRIDPDGALGVRKYFESPYRPGEKITVEEFYRWIFENSVPGLPEAAAKQGLAPLEYMRRYGAFLVHDDVYRTHETRLEARELEGAEIDPVTNVISRGGNPIGVEVEGDAHVGFPTPSRRLEFYSRTLKEWRWPEYAVPGYIKSHVHWENIDPQKGEMLLLPTFRLPTLIHTRSGNAKWLYEISHRNPLWIHPRDAERLKVRTEDLLKVHTEIGYFVDKVWVTEGIRPGVIACSHHLGRWRLQEDLGGERWSTALVDLKPLGHGKWMMRQVHGIRPFKSEDPDSERIWWKDGGVHQNLVFPVQPDLVSGQHCWHQKVRVEGVGAEDRYGDIFVDTNKAHEVYKRWLKMTRPAPGPNNLRRPLWLPRAYRPATEAYYLP
ncbi:MAG: molybdopterin-dependent oxidoreductase [Deltaproteobacteria bacterium]|nr:molybdopterin-dependent oxidoreductase [Deltaproteobacteria bacterium]